MNRSSKFSIWLFLITFTLAFYGMGASFVESLVNYPTWRLIGANEFRAYHQALSPLIVGYMVIPLIVTTLLTGAMLWFRPLSIPQWMIWSSIALQIVIWTSTVLFQLPIQFELSSTGLSLTSIDRLIFTNFWFRRIPGLLNNILFFWMMARLIAPRHLDGVDN